jgi:hypothetical protein
MADHSTTVSLGFKGPGTGEVAEVSLVLEQKPFPQDSGEVKSIEQTAEDNDLEFIEMHYGPGGRQVAFSSNTDEINELYQAQCGKNPDGSITATVYVFKTPTDLSYNLVASRGSFIGEPVTESTEKEESLNFHLDTSVSLGYTVEEILSIEWEGDIYNSSGGVIQSDVPLLVGTELVVDEPVYGTVRVKYTVFGDTWFLNIPPREEASADEFRSTVHAFYGLNQVETIEISPPNLETLCSQRVSWAYNSDGEQPADDEPVDDGSGTADGSSVGLQLNSYDYCHGGVVPGATYWIGNEQVPATGHTVKRGMTYTITVRASGYKDFINSFSV